MIQTAIAYHECKDETDGKVDIKKLKSLADKYAIENGMGEGELDDIFKLIEISSLLKDADALDRFRFAERGQLKTSVLRSSAAKSVQVQSYAKLINERVATKILEQVCNVKPEDREEGKAVQNLKLKYRNMYDLKILEETYGKRDVDESDAHKILQEERRKNIQNGCQLREKHLDFSDIYSIPFPTLENDKDKVFEKENEKILETFEELYKREKLTHDDIRRMKNDVQKNIVEIREGQKNDKAVEID